MGVAYDLQTRRLYDWEHQWKSFNTTRFTTLYQPRKRIRWACRMYRVPVPAVVWRSPARGYPDYDPITHRIRIAPYCNSNPIAIHEAAHAIHDWLFGAAGEPHSPAFVGIYVHLLVKWRVAPATAFVASLIEAGVRFIPLTTAAPAALYRAYKREIATAARHRRLGL
jgi:hypothetical protein